MHEMLGNQYFLARNYSQAKKELETALNRSPRNLSIKKKLIICHIQAGSLDRALQLFADVVTDDIRSITGTDPLFDDCPCPQLALELENSIDTADTRERNLALGMIWLFCDIQRSYRYFSSIPDPNDDTKRILTQLQSTMQQLQPTRNV